MVSQKHGEKDTLKHVPNRMIASCFGGVLTSLVMTPLDVVKVRMQSSYRSNHCFIYCNGLMDHLCAATNSSKLGGSVSRIWFKKSPSKKYVWWRGASCSNPEGLSSCVFHSTLKQGTLFSAFGAAATKASSLEVLASIVKNEGILSLWSGLSPTLLMALPQTVIYYSLNDWLKCHIARITTLNGWEVGKDDILEIIAPPVVGAISRVFAVFAISPLELMRTKLQSRPMTLKTFYDTARATVSQGGIKSLWMGVGPTLLRDVPYSAIFWCIFDYNKNKFYESRTATSSLQDDPLKFDFSVAFTYGATAGFTAGLVTHPFDVIKTHRQLELGEALFGRKRYSGTTWNALKRLYRDKGINAIYSGFTPRLLKTTVASALMVSVFEVVKQNLGV